MNIEFQLISEAMRIYQERRAAADVSMEEVADNASMGVETNKKMAGRDCEEIAFFIRGLVEQDSAAIFLLGPEANQAKFAALAEDEEEAFVVPAQRLYQELAEVVKPYLDHGKFNVTTAQALAGAMHNLAKRLRVMSFVFPNPGSAIGTPINGDTDLTDLVRKMVRAANGDELNAVFIAHVVFEQVIDTRYDNNGVTVVVTGATEDEARGELAQKLFGGRTVTVDVSKEPEKNDIVVVGKNTRPFFARASSVFQRMSAQKARAAKAQKAAEDSVATTADKATNPPTAS